MLTGVFLLAAFVAGVLSFSSPCILPIIPLYLTHMAGVTAGDGAAVRRVVVRNAMAFVLGFGLIFVAFGAALGAVGVLAGGLDVLTANRSWIVQVGGLLLIALGLYQTSLIRLPMLERERRLAFVPVLRHRGFIVPDRHHLRRRLVSLRRPDPRRHPDDGGRAGQHFPGHAPAGGLCGGPGDPIPGAGVGVGVGDGFAEPAQADTWQC